MKLYSFSACKIITFHPIFHKNLVKFVILEVYPRVYIHK